MFRKLLTDQPDIYSLGGSRGLFCTSLIMIRMKVLYESIQLLALTALTQCEVEANPEEVKFRWTFNNSAEMIKVNNTKPASRLISAILIEH